MNMGFWAGVVVAFLSGVAIGAVGMWLYLYIGAMNNWH